MAPDIFIFSYKGNLILDTFFTKSKFNLVLSSSYEMYMFSSYDMF